MNRSLLYILYFLSGFSALIYEVVWLRKLELVFGTTTYAVSTVLAVFFTGLAVGSWVFGSYANKMRMDSYSSTKPEGRVEKSSSDSSRVSSRLAASDAARSNNNSLLLYGLLELGIGFYAALTPWIFVLIEQGQAYVWRTFEPSFAGFSVVTFVLAASGLILPTVLMGGTFPVAAKAATLISADIGANLRRADERGIVGWLYGLNTLGAVLGVLAAGFFLIASIGVNQTIWVAAGISLLIGGIALYLSRTFG